MLDTLLRGNKITLNGYNAAIVNAAYEDIADMSAVLVVQATAGLAIKVASSSANDVMTSGTGAWKIRLFGVDASGAFQTEDIALNGTTAVASTKTWGLAGRFPVFGAMVIAVGTGGVAAGNICVVDNAVTVTAGVSQDMTKTYALINIGFGMSHNAFFQVPKGEQYTLTSLQVSNRAQIVDYSIMVYLGASGTPFRLPMAAMAATTPINEIKFSRGQIMLPEYSLIRICGMAATTGGIGVVVATLEKWFQAK